MIPVAVAGAGLMARRRALALVSTGQVEICGVAATREASARRLADELGCRRAFDDVRGLLETRPRAILVEVPNAVQDGIVMWALEAGLDVLIGGPLSTSVAGGRRILGAARAAGVVVEAGFEARYKPVWELARDVIANGPIGRVIAVRTVALWACDPRSWYAREVSTGGMPMVHMTYAFVNPLRWLLGEPTHVSALANQIANTAPGAVLDETCIANLQFPQSVICTMTAGFVKALERETWAVWFLGTEGAVELLPTELDGGSLAVHQGRQVRQHDCTHARDAFVAQARAFVAALNGEAVCRNSPQQALGDLRVVEAITRSIRTGESVRLAAAPSAGAAPSAPGTLVAPTP